MNALTINFLKRKDIQLLLSIYIGLGVIGAVWYIGLFSIKYLLLLLIIPLTLFVLYKPFWGLCAFAFMIPLEDTLLVSENVTALKVLGVFIFLGWLIRFFFLKQTRIFMSRAIFISFLFAGWGLMSYFWAVRPDAVLWREMTLVLLVGIFFLIPQIVTDTKKLHYLILSNVFGAMVGGGFGLYYFMLNPNQRIVAFPEFGQGLSGYGISISLGIFYFLTLLISKSKRITKFFSFTVFLTLLIAALSSGTRTFMVSFAVSLLFLFWYLVRTKGTKVLLKSVVIFFIVVIIIVSIMPPLFFERAESILTVSDQWAGRTDIWKVYGTVILRHPFLGVGLENGVLFFGEYMDEAQALYRITIRHAGVARSEFYVPHNIYILSWAELGIVGFILLLLLIISLFKRLYLFFSKITKDSPEWQLGLAIGLNFIALLVMGIGEPILYRKYLWFGFSLILAYSRIVRNSTLVNKSRNEIELREKI